MKILVMGKTGQVAKALSETGAGRAGKIAFLDRDQCDLSNEMAVRAAISRSDASVVVNAAAYTAVDKAESEEAIALLVNGTSPGWMASQCVADRKRFVQISTDFVFNGQKSAPYLPNDRPAPLNIYGRSTLLGEKNVQSQMPDALILRTSWVYSTSGTNFLLTMLRLMKERDELGVVDDQVGCPTAACEIADAIVQLTDLDAKSIHHFTNEGVASWYDFAVAIYEEGRAAGIIDREIRVNPIPSSSYPTLAQRPANSVLDKQATRKLLPHETAHWRSALRKVIKELSKNE
jgi:dTDP-4-dehydrorhamnose reductase